MSILESGSESFIPRILFLVPSFALAGIHSFSITVRTSFDVRSLHRFCDFQTVPYGRLSLHESLTDSILLIFLIIFNFSDNFLILKWSFEFFLDFLFKIHIILDVFVIFWFCLWFFLWFFKKLYKVCSNDSVFLRWR